MITFQLPSTDNHTTTVSLPNTTGRLVLKAKLLKDIKNERVNRDKAQALGDAIKREVKKEGKEAHRGTMT